MKNLFQSARNLRLGWISFHQDSDPKHTATYTLELFKAKLLIVSE